MGTVPWGICPESYTLQSEHWARWQQLRAGAAVLNQQWCNARPPRHQEVLPVT